MRYPYYFLRVYLALVRAAEDGRDIAAYWNVLALCAFYYRSEVRQALFDGRVDIVLRKRLASAGKYGD